MVRGAGSGTGAADARTPVYLMSCTPRALLPVPEPLPGPTVPVPRMSTNLPTRHDVEPLPVSQTALLDPWMYAPSLPEQSGSAGSHSQN